MSVAAYLERAAELSATAISSVMLQRILDRAMADDDGGPVLAPGEAAEARRLLRMVRWERVPVVDERRRLKALADVAWLREQGSKAADGAERFVRMNLAEEGLLVEKPKGRAA